MKLVPLFFLFISFCPAFGQEINQLDEHGQRHGKWMKKYEGTDKIRYRGTFDHGREIGTFEFFKRSETSDKDTYLFATRTYAKENDVVTITYFTPLGNTLSTGQMEDKKRIGKWIYYHPDSDTIMMTENYEHGKLDGAQITYYPNGTVAKKTMYKDGKKEGVEKIYGKNGSLLKYFTYKNGELNGITKYFDANGNLLAKGMYKNNRKDGVWETYENGKVVKTTEYPKYE